MARRRSFEVMPGAQDGRRASTVPADLLDHEGVTFSAGVPTVWIEIINEMRRRGWKPDKLERVIIGGSACPEWMISSLEKDYGVEVMHAWGMTEMSPVGSAGIIKPEMADLDEAGRMQLKLKQGAAFLRRRDADRRRGGCHGLPNDGEAAGRLMVRGCAVVGEYFKGAGGDILDADGWFDTGDLATIDEHGYMQITDRTKDVIKSGGEWISSVELENIASGHDEVVEAAAIGIPDEKWAERPRVVLVVLKAGSTLTPDELRDYLPPAGRQMVAARADPLRRCACPHRHRQARQEAAPPALRRRPRRSPTTSETVSRDASYIHAAETPDKPAVIMARSGEVVTYRQLDERSRPDLRICSRRWGSSRAMRSRC